VAQDGTAITGIFLIDSGATTAIWLTKALSEAHPEFLSIPETIEVRNVVAVGGALSTRLGRLPAVRLGGFVVANPCAQFSQNSSGIFATAGLAGTIGAQMLRRFKVVLDYPHMEMILEPNEHFNETERKSTRLNSSHVAISYAVFFLKKKKPIPSALPSLQKLFQVSS